MTAFAHAPGRKGAVGLADRFDQVAQRNAIKRQLGRIRHHPQCHALATSQEGQPDIIDLGDLGPKLAGQLCQRLIVPVSSRTRLRSQCQHDDRHVIDSAHRHLRRGNANRNPGPVGLDLLINPDRSVFGV